MDDNRRQRFRGRGRMRSIGGRPQRPEGENQRPHDDRPPRQDRPQQDRPQQRGGQGRHEPRMDPMTQRRMRDDRVYGALCHAGFFLGLWGIATTAGIWALRKDWSRSLRLTGVQALVYQSLAQVAFLVLAVVACSNGALTQIASLLDKGGIFELLANNATHALAFTQLALGCIAALYAFLCIVGFEPSYPLIGFFSRLALGIKAPKRPEEPQAKEQKPEEKKPEEKKPEDKSFARPPAPAPRAEERLAPRPPAPAPRVEERFTPRPPAPAPAPKPEERPALTPLPKPVPQEDSRNEEVPTE